jgi:hypothetical protein
MARLGQPAARRPGAAIERERRLDASAALPLFDRYWPLAMLALTPLFVWLNYEGQGMQGIVPNYVCHREVILAGFDPDANDCGTPTFPMWGYGWLLLVTESKLALLAFQNLLAIGALWAFVSALEHAALLRDWPLRLVKLLLVLSIPFYAFNSLRWPYSVAVSLFLVALALLVRPLTGGPASYGRFVLSGALVGLALNFRSDYIGLVPLIAALAVALGPRPRLRLAGRMGAWLAAVAAALVPWAAYAYHATGHVLLTSTNSGHVLYIGLGQLPGNPWGITASDGDPRMHREVDERFGRPATSTLVYESDVFLRSRFLELVREHPGAYARKVARNVRTTLTGGFYTGEFLEERSCAPDCRTKYGFVAGGAGRTASALAPFVDGELGVVERLRYLLFAASVIEGRSLSLVGFSLAPLLLLLALLRRLVVPALLALVALFQLAINALAYYLPSYSANVYVPLVVLLGLSLQLALDRRRRAIGARPRAAG